MVFFSFGAMIGAMITMYGAVSNRQREVGTLRALGFSRLTILSSFLIESVVLALLGGLCGAVASLAMGFVKLSMMNQSTWSEMVFSFDPSVGIVLGSVLCGGLMGVFGGLLPAVRAARVSPIAAMRGEWTHSPWRAESAAMPWSKTSPSTSAVCSRVGRSAAIGRPAWPSGGARPGQKAQRDGGHQQRGEG